MAPHAAPSREQPTASTDLEAGRELKLGEFGDVEITLSLSEARIVLQKVTEIRSKGQQPLEENDNITKTRDYLEIFSVFKDPPEAEASEALVTSLGPNLHVFEKGQLKTLIPTCADEAKALIPSLEKKIEDGLIDENDLEQVCVELQKVKLRAELDA